MVCCTVARKHENPVDKSVRLREICELTTDFAAVSLIEVFSCGDLDKGLNDCGIV